MEAAIKAIQETPVPTMLIVAGLFFILLGFISKLGGMIEVSSEQKKFTIPIGLLVLTIGLVLYFDPSLDSVSPGSSSGVPLTSELTPTPTLSSPVSNSSEEISAAEPTPTPALSPSASETFPISNEVDATIDDPDGYTNIRSGQGTQYSIIARVNEGEVFYTIPQQSNDWWPVRTKDNRYGYLHRSRIKLQN